MACHLDTPTLFCFRRLLSLRIRSAENVFDRYATMTFFLVACFITFWTWVESHSKPLWFDEQLGLAASTMPQIRDVIMALALPVDINPPLYHILARTSINLFGYSAMAARLPSLLGMLIFLFCLFVFISRRLRRSYGVLAVLLIMCTPVSSYTWEGRPYALLLGFTGIALVSYQRRVERRGILSLIVFIICCACLCLTHYYGVLIVCAFGITELLRTIARLQVDWQLQIGMLFAPSTTLFLLRHLIISQKAAMEHYHAQGALQSFVYGYGLLSTPTWVLCIGIAGLAILHWLQISAQDETGEAHGPGFSSSELALAATLLALPLVGVIVSKFTHAYLARYFIAACAGYAILICYLAASFHRRCAGVALLLSITASAGLFNRLVLTLRARHNLPPLASIHRILGNLDHPILFEDAKDYVMARQLNPQMSGRLYYAAEPEIALKMTGTDSDDKLMRSLAKLQPVQVKTLNDITRESELWIVVPGSVGWLTQCLEGMVGIDRRLISAKEILAFTVRLPRPELMSAPWCEAQGTL